MYKFVFILSWGGGEKKKVEGERKPNHASVRREEIDAAVFNTLHQSHFQARADVVLLSHHQNSCLKVCHSLQCCHNVVFKI